jgi:beta-lactamase superfamily II metal-dependent hydrolase
MNCTSTRVTLASRTWAVVLVFAFGGTALRASPAVGEALPPHAAGMMDIHHINMGEGSAALLVLPDQTTLLIDCGSSQSMARPPRFKAPPKPDGTRLPGEWVARYVKKVHPRGADAPVDYGLVSHFHADHIAGLPEFFRHVRISTLLDRGWPDYGEPLPFTGGGAGMYRGAVAEQVKRHGMKIDRFRGGVADQIVLRHEPGKYRNFEVRHLAVNGEAWTGEGTTMRRRVDPARASNENAMCAAMRIRYGAFDYFTGGDLLGTSDKPDIPASRDMESAIAWVTGPVDVMMLNHHGNHDATSPFFISALQPRVCVAQVWDAQQVDPIVLGRLRSEMIAPGPRDIFMTNGEWEGRDEHVIRVFGDVVGRKHNEDLKTIASRQGHVVVRVAPGGATYNVIVLTDEDESLRIRSIHGPYSSR